VAARQRHDSRDAAAVLATGAPPARNQCACSLALALADSINWRCAGTMRTTAQVSSVWLADIDTRTLNMHGRTPLAQLAWTLLQARRVLDGFTVVQLSATTAVLYKEVPVPLGGPATAALVAAPVAVGGGGAAAPPDGALAGMARQRSDFAASTAPRASGPAPSPVLAVQYIVRHDPIRGLLHTDVWVEPAADAPAAEILRQTLTGLAAQVQPLISSRT